MKSAVLMLFLLCSISGCDHSQRRGPADHISALLDRQAACWNEGDLEGYMDCYWPSDNLTFSAGGTTTHGWQATLDRYRQRYPTPRAMGQLQFSELDITLLADDGALTLGRWQLDMDGTVRAGNFSLVLRKFGERWLIIHDHSSLDPSIE